MSQRSDINSELEHDAGALQELPDGGKKKVKLAGTRILLVRSGDEVFALQDRCAHMKFPLSLGRFDGQHVTCRLHGARFDVRSGEVDKRAWFFGNVGQSCVPTYPVTIRDGRIHVQLPE